MQVIPRPMQCEEAHGNFVINAKTVIIIFPGKLELKHVGDYFADKLAGAVGSRLDVGTSAIQKNSIMLTTNGADAALGAEGYELLVTPDAVTVRAPAVAGLFYGVQTLLQLLPPDVYCTIRSVKTLALPCGKIVDRPRFGWRGMMLDVSRHFFTVESIKRYIDLLAMHKLNVFHWHLTDDGGWRIEIKKHPKLTEIGAWRGGDGRAWNWQAPFGRVEGRKIYGGFYTQAEIREVVDYARSRFVRIVPEIELPGHSRGASWAYPELRCTPADNDQNVFCAGKDATFKLFEDVLDEVMELFPGVPIHIGGDEVNKYFWKDCPLCQKRIRDEKLKDLDELQSYFIRRIEKFVNSRGRSIIGWDEILEGGLAPNAQVMSWRGIEGGIAAANAGHDVVMSPTSHCYFDYCQAEDKSSEPLCLCGFLPLKTVYSYEPMPPQLPPEKQKHVLGAQANVWTEYIEDPNYCDYMTFPRLTAFSEVVWSPAEHRNWNCFVHRLDTHFQRLNVLNVNYRKPRMIDF